jgi:hypothetical protein
MRRLEAQPHYNFFARVNAETNERRRRLQSRLNCTAAELVTRALRKLDDSCPDEREHASTAT